MYNYILKTLCCPGSVTPLPESHRSKGDIAFKLAGRYTPSKHVISDIFY